MSLFGYARRSFARAGWRNAAYLVGLTVAVALFSGTLFFIDGSMRTMTQRAVSAVAIDFQARAMDTDTDVTQFADRLRGQPGVHAVLPFASAQAEVERPTVASQRVPIRLLGMTPNHDAEFPLAPQSTELTPDGALVSEQLAVELRLKPGAVLNIVVPGLDNPYPVTVTGTLNTDLADPLFSGPTATPEGAYNVATDVVAIDFDRFQRDLSSGLQIAFTNATPITNTALPGFGLPLLDRQLHVRIQRSVLASDPGAAATQIAAQRSQLERQAPGQIKITDNLTSTLTGAARDVVSARLLFVFLGLPGVLLAAYLARYSASLVTEAQRRDVALLRARGLAPREVLGIMGWVAGFTAAAGTAAGLALGLLAAVAIFGAGVFDDIGALIRSAAVALLLGTVLGTVGVFLPARGMVAAEISEERRSVGDPTRPVWMRLPVDFALLVAAALALWFSSSYNSRTSTTGATETAAVSLGIYAFLGPLLFWTGAALLFLRASDWVLSRPPTRWREGLSGLVSRSLRRRRTRSSGAALLLALALSFGVASTIFSASFDTSRRNDARYLVGSDLRVTPALTDPQPATFSDALDAPGVRATTPVWVANNVLLGSQKQTVYGVEPESLLRATTIEDRFFVGASARTVLDQLRTTADGLLVSNELATSYNIEVGDTVAMRLPNAAGEYTVDKLRVLGMFILFPTSSQNSDLIVNGERLARGTGNPNPGFFLVRTDGAAGRNEGLANEYRQRFGQRIALRIETADHAISLEQSSLVGVNLAGLAGLERLYSALVIGLALAVFLLGSIIERRREFGTLQALGATAGQVTGLLLREGALLAASGIAGGAIIGVVLAWQYDGFLPGIFSVPVPDLTVPSVDLALLLILAFVGVAAAALAAGVRLRRLWPAEALRDL